VTDCQSAALRLAEGLEANASNLMRVAGVTSPEDARWAFGQWSLRQRGLAKFALSKQMLFDVDGLEMATHETVAAYHASRFPIGSLVADLTCGIGADLIALARRGPALGFELDAGRASHAIHNLAVHGLQAEIAERDSLASEWAFEYAFCDPSRRSHGRRTLDTSQFSPDPRQVAERMRNMKLGGIKLSPMLSDRELEAFGGRLEFISFGGECREALVWLGSLPEPGRRAVHIQSRSTLEAGADPPVFGEPMRFLFEADPAAIRAHCLGTLCDRHGLSALGDSNGYLTGNGWAETPWLKTFEVLTSHPADIKRTKTELKLSGGGTPIVKSRVAGVDVEKLQRELRAPGIDGELAVIVYAVGRSVKHVICKRRAIIG
jgi:hypothetical protein